MSKKKKKSRIKLDDICKIATAIGALVTAVASMIQTLK